MLIPFSNLKQKYKFNPTGVLHVGASEGQELTEYFKLGIKDIIFIEALPKIFEVLCKKTMQYDGVICYNECISDIDGEEIIFNVANNGGQSSSFLDFGTHKQMHPDVSFIDHIKLRTIRLDTLFPTLDKKFNFLNMDLQGAEGHALRGMGSLLDQFDYLYLEVNTTEVYKGCMQLPEMDEFLKERGFKRVETFFPGNCTWGDAFYIRMN